MMGEAAVTWPLPWTEEHAEQQLGCRLDTADFQKGDLYIVRYRPVQQLLKDKWIALI